MLEPRRSPDEAEVAEVVSYCGDIAREHGVTRPSTTVVQQLCFEYARDCGCDFLELHAAVVSALKEEHHG